MLIRSSLIGQVIVAFDVDVGVILRDDDTFRKLRFYLAVTAFR